MLSEGRKRTTSAKVVVGLINDETHSLKTKKNL